MYTAELNATKEKQSLNVNFLKEKMRSPFKKEEVQQPPEQKQEVKEVKKESEKEVILITSEQLMNSKLDTILLEIRLLHEKFDLASK